MMRPMPSARAVEAFAVETEDGLVFTVKGLVHPPDRVVAYLRYVPDSLGDRERNGTRYRRVYRFKEQEDVLRSRLPSYLLIDPMFGTRLQSVPWEAVRVVHDPCLYLQHILRRGPRNGLEQAALGLVELLWTTAGVSPHAIGLSGSLLVGLQGTTSDIDVVVYGEAEGRAVHDALSGLLDEPGVPLRRLQARELAALHEAHRNDTPISADDFARMQVGKVNEGRFCERPYFVRFVKRPSEVLDRYGDPRYETLGTSTVRARVTDHADAMFTPCRYAVDHVEYLEGVRRASLREVVSFRGRFADQAKSGEWVLARGSLERVLQRGEHGVCRLTVGGHPGDYLTSGREQDVRPAARE